MLKDIFNKCSSVAETGDRLATIDMVKNRGLLCPWRMGKGGAGSSSNTMWPGLRPTCVPSFTLIHPTVWPQYTNITDIGRKFADVPLFGGGVGAASPSNTMWPGLRPTCLPNGILIRPTVWPQYTYVADGQTDRQETTNNGPIAHGEYKRSRRNFHCVGVTCRHREWVDFVWMVATVCHRIVLSVGLPM